MGVRFVDLEQLAVEPDMARLVPEHLARRYQVFPVDLKDNRLTLAMHDPLNVIALDDIRLATGFDLDPVIAIKRHSNGPSFRLMFAAVLCFPGRCRPAGLGSHGQKRRIHLQ